MMQFPDVTARNALLYAMQCYDNPQCLSKEEFIEDYKRFKYIKRLCKRYLANQHVSDRLMLNHLILLTNVFGFEGTLRLLFVKCEDEQTHRILKPFLLYLNMCPPTVAGVNGRNIVTSQIPTDVKLWARLQSL